MSEFYLQNRGFFSSTLYIESFTPKEKSIDEDTIKGSDGKAMVGAGYKCWRGLIGEIYSFFNSGLIQHELSDGTVVYLDDEDYVLHEVAYLKICKQESFEDKNAHDKFEMLQQERNKGFDKEKTQKIVSAIRNEIKGSKFEPDLIRLDTIIKNKVREFEKQKSDSNIEAAARDLEDSEKVRAAAREVSKEKPLSQDAEKTLKELLASNTDYQYWTKHKVELGVKRDERLGAGKQKTEQIELQFKGLIQVCDNEIRRLENEYRALFNDDGELDMQKMQERIDKLNNEELQLKETTKKLELETRENKMGAQIDKLETEALQNKENK